MRTYEVVCESNGNTFVPYEEDAGGYPFYSKERIRITNKALRFKDNKEIAATLEEAVDKFRTGQYGWRLYCEDTKQRNLFTNMDKVKIRES